MKSVDVAVIDAVAAEAHRLYIFGLGKGSEFAEADTMCLSTCPFGSSNNVDLWIEDDDRSVSHLPG